MLLKKAYEYLERSHPLPGDCGRLCNKACCRGEGEIWLLPGEQKLFEGLDGFKIKQTGGEYNLQCTALCDGNRSIRPFCCRIFPYFPVVKRTGDKLSVRLIYDPRGYSVCPIVHDEIDCRSGFAREVRRAVRLLCTRKEYFDFFCAQGETLEEILKFKERLGAN